LISIFRVAISGSVIPPFSFHPGTASDHQLMHGIQSLQCPAQTKPAAATDLFFKSPVEREKFPVRVFF
jgi:hypothetical protein